MRVLSSHQSLDAPVHRPTPNSRPRLRHGQPAQRPVRGCHCRHVALVPLYATNRYGFNALDSGTLLIAQGVAAIILSFAGALALRRTGHRQPLYIGGAVMAVGTLLLSFSPLAGIPPYVWLAGTAFLVGAGSGAINPASRNAGLQLAPEHSSTLAALRSMCRQIGAITAISITTAILASADDPGHVQAWVYVVAALLLVAALPLITRIPDTTVRGNAYIERSSSSSSLLQG